MIDGESSVDINPIFTQTVNLHEDYFVFLTPLGDCALYVAEKTSSSFKIKTINKQKCNLTFDYRIVAKRIGYEDLYLDSVADPIKLLEEIKNRKSENK